MELRRRLRIVWFSSQFEPPVFPLEGVPRPHIQTHGECAGRAVNWRGAGPQGEPGRENISFLGRTPRPGLPRVLCAGDLLAFPRSFAMQRGKVVVLGDSRAGKTSLLRRLISGVFAPGYASSVGIDWFSKCVYVDTPRRGSQAGELESDSHGDIPELTEVRLVLWDTGGQERFKSLTSSYTKDAAVAILVYDASDRSSWEAVAGWAEMARQGNEQIALFLAANKIDLPRAVSSLEGERMSADSRFRGYFECSCKTGQGVDELFKAVGLVILEAEQAGELACQRRDTIDIGSGPTGYARPGSGSATQGFWAAGSGGSQSASRSQGCWC